MQLVSYFPAHFKVICRTNGNHTFFSFFGKKEKAFIRKTFLSDFVLKAYLFNFYLYNFFLYTKHWNKCV